MQEYRLKRNYDEVFKVFLNDGDDFIIINPADSSFIDKFAQFMAWIDEKSAELNKIAKDADEKYEGRPVIKEDGENIIVDTEQLQLFTGLRTDLYKECAERIDQLFGEGTLRKYFKEFYDINPDFIPDEDCINDFLENIKPAVDAAYGTRAKRLEGKYNKSRTGRRKQRTKDELIEAYKNE